MRELEELQMAQKLAVKASFYVQLAFVLYIE
jgi:hypothetical protein